MRPPLATNVTRRRFLGGTAALAGGAALSACAASAGDGDKGTTLTVMTTNDDFKPEFIAQAEQALGVKIKTVANDPTKLTAMLASGEPPDIVRGLGALDTPFIAARGLALDLDPYFAASTALKVDDLDPVNDVWRWDGTKQGAGPRYGMAKDYSQDAMFWYNTALFDEMDVEYPSETEPVRFDEWLDLGKRLTQRDGEKIKVYGLDATGMGVFVTLMTMTGSAGGRLLAADLSTVDFSSPEARAALQWYLDFARANVGFSPANPNPDGWAWPPYQAGRLAIADYGYWFGGAIGGDEKIAEASRFAPAPQFGDNRISPCSAATGFWIPKNGKNIDAAWKFFEWYFGGQPAKDRASGGWGLPSLVSLRELLPQDKPYQKQAYEVQQAELEHLSVLTFSPYARVEALDAVLNQHLPDAIGAGTSAGELADALNGGVNELLAAGKELVK